MKTVGVVRVRWLGVVLCAALGARLLGAAQVIGVDVDESELSGA